jgi:hypothetical protein
MDDFIALAQGPPSTLSAVRSTLFYSIDEVFRPLQMADNTTQRKHPISIKKLNLGDGQWSHRKIILGWVVDTQRETIELPPHRANRLIEILTLLLHRRRVSLRQWQKYLGELRSMVLALPGGRGLFSTLYTGITSITHQKRVRISRPIRDSLSDFFALATDLCNRPTRLGEIVDSVPVAFGTADASGQGMGGVWLSAMPDFCPILWRAPFPPNIQCRLITDDNPTGSITNSDLELAGQIAAQDALLQNFDCRERTLAVFTDNISARAWQRKGSHATLGPSAYLLRLLSLHQRHYRYNATFDYLPGPLNVMADDASRLWTLSNSDLLTRFNTLYPQNQPWQLYILRPEILSALTTALLCKRSDLALCLPAPSPETLPGFAGPHIVKAWVSLHSARTSGIHYSTSKSLPTVTAPAHLHPVTTLSDLVPWKGPSGPWARCWPYWGPQTHALTNTAKPTTYFNNSYEDTADWIHPLLE